MIKILNYFNINANEKYYFNDLSLDLLIEYEKVITIK